MKNLNDYNLVALAKAIGISYYRLYRFHTKGTDPSGEVKLALNRYFDRVSKTDGVA